MVTYKKGGKTVGQLGPYQTRRAATIDAKSALMKLAGVAAGAVSVKPSWAKASTVTGGGVTAKITKKTKMKLPVKMNPNGKRPRRNGTVKRMDGASGSMRTFARDALVYEPVFNDDQTALMGVRAVPVRKTHPGDYVYASRLDAKDAGRAHARDMSDSYHGYGVSYPNPGWKRYTTGMGRKAWRHDGRRASYTIKETSGGQYRLTAFIDGGLRSKEMGPFGSLSAAKTAASRYEAKGAKRKGFY